MFFVGVVEHENMSKMCNFKIDFFPSWKQTSNILKDGTYRLSSKLTVYFSTGRVSTEYLKHIPNLIIRIHNI